MTVTTAIILGVIISFIIIYITLNFDKLKPRKKYEHQDLIDKIHSRIAKANGSTIEQFSLENSAEAQRIKRDNLYKNANFINKNCTSLEDFIINDEINEFDLRKLTDLNQIQLQISEAWYPLTLQLIKELNENGWEKKVSCIKEKYAELKFYLPDDYKNSDKIYEIIQKYEKKSKYICETCGARGEIRHNSGWDYVACRKHYLENRGKIFIENLGFNHNGLSYKWKNVKNIYFEDFDEYQLKYSFLIVEFNKQKVKHQGWTDNKLYISKNLIGCCNFINNLPKSFPNIDINYLKHFENPQFCEICGYKSVYYNECECCENDIWDKNILEWKNSIKRFNQDENKYKRRIEFYQEKLDNKEKYKIKDISYNQIRWVIDEGDIYEKEQKNYLKNPNYKILFSKDEYEEYSNDT